MTSPAGVPRESLRDAVARAIHETGDLAHFAWDDLKPAAREHRFRSADAVLGVLAVRVEENWDAMVEAGFTSWEGPPHPRGVELVARTRTFDRADIAAALRAALSELGVGGAQ